MIKVDVREAVETVTRDLQLLQRKQIPFAIADGLNETAKAVKTDLVEAMKRDFDRPTPFTLNAFYIKYARKTDLEAFVGIREFASKGTPAWKYLQPEIQGGERHMKRFEKRLSDLSGGQYAIPARGAKLDAYGNVSRGQIMQILSRLSVMGDRNASDKTQKRLAKKGLKVRNQAGDYFIARAKGNGRPLGIYQLVGRGKVEPVFIFTPKAPHYTIRYPFAQIGRDSVNKHFSPALQRGMTRALATAR